MSDDKWHKNSIVRLMFCDRVVFRMFSGMYEEEFTPEDIVNTERYRRLDPKKVKKDCIQFRTESNKLWMDYHRHRLSSFSANQWLTDPIIKSILKLKTHNYEHPPREKFLKAVLESKMQVR